MNDRERLLRKISAAQFAAWELHIYLDTHPDDCDAAESLDKYRQRAKELREQYRAKYGPLNAQSAIGSTAWSWVKDPWPWEEQTEV